METPSTPRTSPSSSSPKQPVVYQVETTGNYWSDVKEAFKRISFWDDMQKIGEIPCARSSLLSGIASGVGIGAIRGMSAGPFVACNWAVGTFTLISLGTWTICRRSLDEERRQIHQVVEQLPKRFAKAREESASPEDPKPSH